MAKARTWPLSAGAPLNQWLYEGLQTLHLQKSFVGRRYALSPIVLDDVDYVSSQILREVRSRDPMALPKLKLAVDYGLKHWTPHYPAGVLIDLLNLASALGSDALPGFLRYLMGRDRLVQMSGLDRSRVVGAVIDCACAQPAFQISSPLHKLIIHLSKFPKNVVHDAELARAVEYMVRAYPEAWLQIVVDFRARISPTITGEDNMYASVFFAIAELHELEHFVDLFTKGGEQNLLLEHHWLGPALFQSKMRSRPGERPLKVTGAGMSTRKKYVLAVGYGPSQKQLLLDGRSIPAGIAQMLRNQTKGSNTDVAETKAAVKKGDLTKFINRFARGELSDE